jgi:serine O-acetyltransferase
MEKFWQNLYQSHQACPTCPSPAEVAKFFSDLLGTLYPDYTQLSFPSETDFENHVMGLKVELHRILRYNPSKGTTETISVAEKFFQALPLLHEKIDQDVTAMFEGDPAAKSKEEVIRTYPGFYAIAAYRIARA